MLPLSLTADGDPAFEPSFFKLLEDNITDPDEEVLEEEYPTFGEKRDLEGSSDEDPDSDSEPSIELRPIDRADRIANYTIETSGPPRTSASPPRIHITKS